MVALCAAAMILAAGAAVDFGKAYYARSAMQTSLDAAALAAAQESIDRTQLESVIEAKLTKVARDTFYASYDLKSSLATITDVTADYTPRTATDPDTTLVTVSGFVPTDFLRMANIPVIPFKMSAGAQPQQPGPMDVVLALDVTLSMDYPPSTGGEKKLDTLKSAATDLVNKLMESGSPNIRVAVVPYNTYVFIGKEMGDTNPDWLLKMQYIANNVCVQWSNAPANCTATGAYTDCYKDGVLITKGCAVINCSGTISTGPVTCLRTVDYNWGWIGCVGPRGVLSNDPYNQAANPFETTSLDNIFDPIRVKYPGTANATNFSLGCPYQKVLDLTSDKTAVLNAISSLTAFGNTYIANGLIWGWNVLDPAAPYTAGRSDDELKRIGGKRALILMTDGVNSQGPRFYDASFWPTGNTSLSLPWRNRSQSDATLAAACSNFKKQSPLNNLFTVLFDVNDVTAADLLKNCASNANTMFFNANNRDGLLKAFTDISDQLMPLKIIR